MTAADHFAKTELNILGRRRPSTYEFCNIAILVQRQAGVRRSFTRCILTVAPQIIVPICHLFKAVEHGYGYHAKISAAWLCLRT
jgi:hypothetical protein